MHFELSPHAQEELVRRGIAFGLAEQTLDCPEQVLPAYRGRKAFQSRIDFWEGKEYLLRVIVDDRVDPVRVITVYRTSRIDRYWSN